MSKNWLAFWTTVFACIALIAICGGWGNIMDSDWDRSGLTNRMTYGHGVSRQTFQECVTDDLAILRREGGAIIALLGAVLLAKVVDWSITAYLRR